MSLLCLGLQSAGQTNILTANYDNYRTNSNLAEVTLTPTTVGRDTFGKLGSFSVDGQIYAQPLYVSRLQFPGGAARNVVYVATMGDSVYALDADTLESLWRVNLGTPVPSFVLDAEDVQAQVGILSTPVIDLGQQVIYVVSDTLENQAPVFRIHALSLLDGHEMLNGPTVIAASVNGSGDGSVNGTLQFDASLHLQRPGLALVNNLIYVAFGSHDDAGPYHGWLLAYNQFDLRKQVAAFNTTPDGIGGAIWQSGRAPAIDSSGNIYVAAANGDFTGTTNFSGAILKLNGLDLSLADWFAPFNWAYLNDNDLDVGSTGPLLVPGSTSLVTGDKNGTLYSIDTSAMGHVDGGGAGFTASPAGIFQLAIWNSDQGLRLYQHDMNGPLKAYQIASGGISPSPVSQASVTIDVPYPGLVVSANGGSGGIVWETIGDFSRLDVPGTLHAYDASDLSRELWNSATLPSRDSLGGFAKFANSLVANGRVYVPTFSNQLVIYGLLPVPGETSEVGGATGPRIDFIANGASLLQGPVSPGEVVAIYGMGLGSSGGCTQVLFDGIGAPLLSTSISEVTAIVPFAVTTPTTRVQVECDGSTSDAVSVPVVPAVPALFSLSRAPYGQGAILNQDGSVNSRDNPASPGSVVVLYATGLGSTDPPGEDGKIATDVLPAPTLPIAVTIGGEPADLLYAGAAPQMVEGVFQVNVRIPETVPLGDIVPISLSAGTAQGPDTITIAIE